MTVNLPCKFRVAKLDAYPPITKERILIWISNLYIKSLRRKEENKCPYHPYPAKSLIYLLGKDYFKILKHLEEERVIEIGQSYIPGVKAKGYRLKPRIQRSGGQYAIGLTCPKVIEIYQFLKDQYKERIKTYSVVYQAIMENLERVSWHPMTLDFARSIDYNSDFQKNYYSHVIDSIENKDYWFSVDPKSGRIFNNVTNMPKALRPFLMLDGKSLVEIDVKTCQPLLLSQYYGNSEEEQREKESFISMIQTKDFYEQIATNAGFQYFQRKQLKEEAFIQVLFAKYKPEKDLPLWDSFQELFPILASILLKIKSTDEYNQIAISLQKIESEIILKKACQKLLEKGIFLLTIHDAILCEEKNFDSAKMEIERAFQESLGFTPQVKTEYHRETIKESLRKLSQTDK